MERTPRPLLAAGIAMPVIYFGNLILASLLYPGYSHVRQYASELGSASARYPAVFNTGVVLIGLAALLAGPGFAWALRVNGSGRVIAWAVAILFALYSVGLLFGGLFPMPDPRHGGYGLGFASYLVPPLLTWGLRKRPELRWLRVFLVVSWVVMLAFLAVMMGVGGLVTRAHVGLWQRGNALASIPWIGIAAWALLPRRDGGAATSRMARGS
jgi:hypothetical membrane protein